MGVGVRVGVRVGVGVKVKQCKRQSQSTVTEETFNIPPALDTQNVDYLYTNMFAQQDDVRKRRQAISIRLFVRG